MSRIADVSTMVAWAVLLCGGAAFPAPSGGATFTLDPSKEEDTHRFALPPASASVAREARVRSVAFDDATDNSAKSAIRTELPAPAEGRQAELVLTVTTARFARHGTYKIDIALSGSKKPVGTMTVTMRRPAAKLRIPAALELESICGWSWDCEEAVALSPGLPVLAMGAGSTVKLLSFAPEPSATVGSAWVEFAPASVRADEKALFAPVLTGRPKLGLTTGALEANAPELAAPIRVTWSLRVRRSLHWLVGFIVLGVAVGYLIRERLKLRLDLDAARLEGVRALEALQAARRRIADPLFHATTSGDVAALAAAVANAPAAELRALAAAADARLETALQDLDARRKAYRDELARLRALGETPWILPAELQAYLDRARVLADEGRMFLDSPASGEPETAHGVRQWLRALHDSAEQLVASPSRWFHPPAIVLDKDAASLDLLAQWSRPQPTADTALGPLVDGARAFLEGTQLTLQKLDARRRKLTISASASAPAESEFKEAALRPDDLRKLGEVDLLSQSIQRQSHRGRLFELAATGLLAVALGWLVLSPAFSGTISDLLKAFLFGFTADLTVDGVLQRARAVTAR